MNRTERITDSVTADFHGSSFGEGIYTANNPCAFKYHGGVGLLVARMKGDTEQWSRRTREPDQFDTIVGNKKNIDFLGYDCFGMYDEIVLRNSAQCLPLMQYRSSLIRTEDNCWVGNKAVKLYHCMLQAVIDEVFNSREVTPFIKESIQPLTR